MLILERIFVRYVNVVIYEYGKSKYGEIFVWKELVLRFDWEVYLKNGELEFDYEIFCRVWVCFWDE